MNLSELWDLKIRPAAVYYELFGRWSGIRKTAVKLEAVRELYSYAKWAVTELQLLRKHAIETGVAKYDSDGKFVIMRNDQEIGVCDAKLKNS